MNQHIPETLDFTNDQDVYTEIPVSVPGEHGGDFILHTISGGNATKYLNQQTVYLQAMSKGDSLRNMAALEPMLLGMSLRDGNGNPVKESTIGKWPFPVQRKLYETAQIISRLNVEARTSNLIYKAWEEHGDDAPCSLQEIREWVNGLDPKEFKSLQLMFSPGDDEIAKNT